MALKTDRSTLQTDISFFMNEAATRGGIASLSAGGSGASMDNGAALVTYKAVASGITPVGLLVNDMVSIDLTRQHLNQHKDEVQKGGKVTLLTKGWVVTSSLVGVDPNAGDIAYVSNSGAITSVAPGGNDSDAHSGGNVVGRFLSDVDEDGYAKVFIDLPSTNTPIAS